MVAPLLDLGAGLAVDESPAAAGARCVLPGRAIDAVPLPDILPQDEDGDAWAEAAEGMLI